MPDFMPLFSLSIFFMIDSGGDCDIPVFYV
nr:MAG TPA: hypothetical protein [Caudoviricetes sp.]